MVVAIAMSQVSWVDIKFVYLLVGVYSVVIYVVLLVVDVVELMIEMMHLVVLTIYQICQWY